MSARNGETRAVGPSTFATMNGKVTLAALLLSSAAFAQNADRKVVLTPHVGLALPSSLTPTQISPTSVGPGVSTQVDAMFVAHKFVEVGAYAHYSLLPITGRRSASVPGLQLTHVVSWGGAVKLRIPIGEKMRLRVGPYIGMNVSVQDFENTTGLKGSFVGYGFNIGPTLEWAYDLAPGLAINAQFGFLSGPGWATLSDNFATLVKDGVHQTQTFWPQGFLTVGVDFYL